MGTLTKSPPLTPGEVAWTDDLLPSECPLAMAPGDLGKTRSHARVPAAVSSTMHWRRAVLLLSTVALTGGGGYGMYQVLQVGGVTVPESMVLALFLALFA